MGDAFWGITLSIIVLRFWWKHQFPKQPKRSKSLSSATIPTIEQKTEAEKQRERDIADLKKQGYTDEVISVILPVINS